MMKIKGGEGPSMAQQTMQKALGGGPKKSWRDNLNPSAAQLMAKAEAANYKGPTYIQSKTHSIDDDDTPIKDDKENHPKSSEPQDSDDEDFLGGDDDQVLAAIHAKRLNELRTTIGKTNEFKAMGHGSYAEISQDEFLPTVTSSKYAIIHFFHPDFEACKIVDKHMTALSPRHLATRFASLNAEKAPFFVTKLALKMLPTIICFKDGIAVDRVVGFDELGATEEFTTATLESRLSKSGCLLKKDSDDDHSTKRVNKNSIRKGVTRDDSDDDDD